MIKDENGQMVNIGLNGEIVEATSKAGKAYKAYRIYWMKPTGEKINVKQVFLSDLELDMIQILQNETTAKLKP